MNLRRRVGPYRIEREIHQGATGVLYQARDESGNPCALKILHAFLIQDMEGLLRALQQLVSSLKESASPYLVPIVRADYDGREDRLYVVYPWVDRAVSLEALMQQEGGRLPLDRVVKYVWKTLLALRSIYGPIGMHGALKPSNMIVDGRGRFFVTDPGLAAAIYQTQHVDPWEVIGASHYLAPELGREYRGAGFATDVYALAAVAYHLLAGRPPFPYDDPVRQRRAHWEENPPPLSDSIPEAFQRWLFQAMAKNPAQRFRDPEGALEALGNILLERKWAIDFWLAEARELQEMGEIGLAGEHLERILRVQPDHPEAALLREELDRERLRREVERKIEEARRLLGQRQAAEADRSIRWLLEHAPQHPEVARLRDRLRELLERPPALVLQTPGGRSFRLQGEGILGRRAASLPPPEVDLGPEDPERYVSRRHARLWFADGTWWIQVYPEATNPTWLNDQLLDKERPYPLPDGSSLRIANLRIRVCWVWDMESPSPEV